MSHVIVVGVDAHEQSRDAVALGARLATATGGDVVLVHVYPYDPLEGSLALGGGGSASPLREEAERILERAAQAAGVPARTVALPSTSPVRGLQLEAVRLRASLLVVGSSHRGALGRIVAGTHTHRVLHGAPCAVAIATRGLSTMSWEPRSIVVAYDASEEARDALALAQELARGAGGRLKVVGVTVPPLAAWAGYAYHPDWRDREEHSREELEAELREAAGEDADVELRAGDAADELIELSGHADLLVMGSRSYGPVRRVLLGATSDEVTREAQCPVVVVPRSARHAGEGEPEAPAPGERAEA